jgi:hypothetical protein
MKKLFAILAVVLLCGSYAFATTDTWTSGNETGTVNATVVCTPELDGPTAAMNLGSFFTGTHEVTTISSTAGTLTWNLFGPTTATYTFTQTIIPAAGLQDDGATGAYLFGTFPTATSALAVASQMTCKGATSPKSYDIVFTPSGITPGATTGGKTWTLTVTASATI